MNKENFDLIRRIVMETASTLQDGKHSTSEDWFEIAEELQRAVNLANEEGNRLLDEELTK